jgi:uncharacterized protein
MATTGIPPMTEFPPLRPFHLAIPVDDIAETRKFYTETLGCAEGRSAADWADFDFYGHQLVAHLAPGLAGRTLSNSVDGDDVPAPHFGIVLAMDTWRELADRFTAAGMEFLIAPCIRFKGEPGEQASMFFKDPSGNAIEMKAFENLAQMFAR